MPITAITIENFKGIAEPVTIPICPITLLFGKNSAGKSTILQALHYLREVLENRRPDPDRTQVGGDAIDLGGFQSLVHRNQFDQRIRIRVAFSLDDDGIPNNGIISLSGNIDLHRTLQEESTWFDLNSEVQLTSAWIEAITAWEEGKGAYIAGYAAGLNGDELVRLRQSYGLHPELLSVNVAHTIAQEIDHGYFPEPDGFRQLCERIVSSYEEHDRQGVPWAFSNPLPLNQQDSIIPAPDKPFPVDGHITDTPTDSDTLLFWSLVGQALTGPLAVLLRELRGIRYLGPIRDVPPRTYRSPKTPMESRWAGGLGAWDTMVRDLSLVETLSHYLQDVLRLGYTIRHEKRIAIDAEGEVMAVLRLLASQYDEKDATYLCIMVLDPLERLPRPARASAAR